MPSSSIPPPIERAKPLLGTWVRIRAGFGTPADGHAATDAAFAEVARVHRLMSFHEPQSDLSRINAAAAGDSVEVDDRTAEVLEFALALAAESGGVFDPAVGPAAVACGRLPSPASRRPAEDASWRDVTREGSGVRLKAPVWLDLGGVAKGYAVDRAVARLQAGGALCGCVDAGGDLRVFGPEPWPVRLRTEGAGELPVVMLEDGALASSGGASGGDVSAHFDGRTGRVLDPGRFACVTAPSCMAADALTKVALALGEDASAILTGRGARAYAFSPAEGWRTFGDGA